MFLFCVACNGFDGVIAGGPKGCPSWVAHVGLENGCFLFSGCVWYLCVQQRAFSIAAPPLCCDVVGAKIALFEAKGFDIVFLCPVQCGFVDGSVLSEQDDDFWPMSIQLGMCPFCKVFLTRPDRSCFGVREPFVCVVVNKPHRVVPFGDEARFQFLEKGACWPLQQCDVFAVFHFFSQDDGFYVCLFF